MASDTELLEMQACLLEELDYTGPPVADLREGADLVKVTRGARIIPDQLKHPDFRFILLIEGNKKPIKNETDISWTEDPERRYRFDDPVLLQHIGGGKNYGVVGGIGGLQILDADNPGRLEELGVLEKLPKTFSVRTPRRDPPEGGRHFYFYCPGWKAGKYVLNDAEVEDGDPHLGELQSGGGVYVLGPGCRHPNGGLYTVADALPIAEISAEALHEAVEALADPKDPSEDQQRGGGREGDPANIQIVR